MSCSHLPPYGMMSCRKTVHIYWQKIGVETSFSLLEYTSLAVLLLLLGNIFIFFVLHSFCIQKSPLGPKQQQQQQRQRQLLLLQSFGIKNGEEFFILRWRMDGRWRRATFKFFLFEASVSAKRHPSSKLTLIEGSVETGEDERATHQMRFKFVLLFCLVHTSKMSFSSFSISGPSAGYFSVFSDKIRDFFSSNNTLICDFVHQK